MKLNKSLILAGTALVAFGIAADAYAQSTASQEIEVIIKGSRKGAGPINKETGVKTRSVIDQQYISTQTSGQSIAQSLNIVPGYNFTNNDPYGSNGGNLRLRGLDGSRISLTEDGIQLNDAGNYAIYTNQQLDPEVIASAQVLTGGTDVDSMTASSTGGTINIVSRKPADTFGVQYTGSIGSWNYTRNFASIDTGKFGPWGTSAFISYSKQNYDTFTREVPDTGKLMKEQLNFKVYQPLFDNGSFISLGGHYNRNRNRFIFGQSLATYADPTKGEYYNSAGPGNVNPSDTGNLRGQSKWVVNDHFYFTVDAAYQYVLANGGGTSSANEVTGKIGSWVNPNFIGVDLNGDGDATDTSVSIYNPNTTQTDRFSLSTSAIYTFSRGDVLRIGYSADRGRTRQTGDGTLVYDNNRPIDVFGAKKDDSLALIGNNGERYERRNRYSKADVDVWSLEYRGRFLDEKLAVSIGIRNQKMTRDLNQFCYSKTDGTGSSSPFCTSAAPTATNADGTVTFAGNTGNFFKPYSTVVEFKKTLPNVGLSYKLTDTSQLYANYSEAMSSPRTDNYYAVTYADDGKTISPANPLPELAKTMELGYRYNTSKLTASVDVWGAKYDNRILSAYDVQTDTYFDRNVGKVDFKGFEGAVAWAPKSNWSLFANATYTDTEIKNDVANGKVAGSVVYIPLSGKEFPEVAHWMGNVGTFYTMGDFQFTLTGKYVGPRYATDVNDMKVPSYLTWDGSIRWNLPNVPYAKPGTYFQLNLINITDKYYYGSISTQTTAFAHPEWNISKAGVPNFNIGAPRTLMLSLHTQF